MSAIKKYLKKGIYLKKKGRKLLMISDKYNSIITEYQKIIHLLGNTPNRTSKFGTKNWVEMMMTHM